MSFPSTNNQGPILSALVACLSQTRAQMAAMESLGQTGEQLFACICRGDTGSLGHILEARSAACVRINELASTASPLDQGKIGQFAASGDPQIRETASEILQITGQIDLLRAQILTRQNECEEALRAALADTARQLREAAGEKKVRFAYQRAVPTSPQYLDSRK